MVKEKRDKVLAEKQHGVGAAAVSD
jgi:hypothetical protein